VTYDPCAVSLAADAELDLEDNVYYITAPIYLGDPNIYDSLPDILLTATQVPESGYLTCLPATWTFALGDNCPGFVSIATAD